MGIMVNMCGISIHALREESDRLKVLVAGQSHTFQSTLSVRRATSKLSKQIMIT